MTTPGDYMLAAALLIFISSAATGILIAVCYTAFHVCVPDKEENDK